MVCGGVQFSYLRTVIMGKGSKRRPEDKNKIDANWDKIFGKNKGPSVDGDTQARARQQSSVCAVPETGYNQGGNSKS